MNARTMALFLGIVATLASPSIAEEDKSKVAASTASPTLRLPKGFHSVTPSIVVSDATKAIEYYGKLFGAKQTQLNKDAKGKIMHAEVEIAGSPVMLSEGYPEFGTAPPTMDQKTRYSSIFLYVPDVDATYKAAIASGSKSCSMEPEDMFWGDRFGAFIDPFGHTWEIATHKEDLTPAEIEKRQIEFFNRK